MIKKTKLSKYNTALFKNMSAHIDAVWAIDPNSEKIEFIYDMITPSQEGQTVTFAEVHEKIRRDTPCEELKKPINMLSKEFLLNLKEERNFENHSLTGTDRLHLLRYTMTPDLDRKKRVKRVYISFQNRQILEDYKNEVQTLREELNRYLSAVSCGIIQYTKESKKIVYANSIALKLLGYSTIREMQEDNFNGVVNSVQKEDADNINQMVDMLFSEDNKAEYEYRISQKDGTEKICYGTAQILKRKDEEPIIQRTIIDITESRSKANS